MSASLLRSVQTASAQVLAVWRAMPGAYLLLGRASGPLPKNGSARLGRDAGAPGIFQTFFWPLGSDQSIAFLTVIRVPDRLPIGHEVDVILRGARGGDRDFQLRLAPICEEEEFGRHLASLASASRASVVRFVLDLLRPEAEVEVRHPILLLQSFLHHGARHEGCVELLLEMPKRLLLLQGWGPATGPDVDIIVIGSSLERHPVQVGEFARKDIQPPLTGSVIAVPAEMAATLSSAEVIFLLTETELFCRRVINPRLLDPASSSGQIRHLLPRLLCPPSLSAALQQALQPQFEGVDTLNVAGRCVRCALDIAVAADGVGIFLSGWLFDPDNKVTRLEYCADDNVVQIGTELVRIQRDDVRLAFKDNPAFPPSTRADIGFAVFAINSLEVPRVHYLRFVLSDADVAFVPLRPRAVSEPGIRALLCNGVDMYKPSGIEVVRHHLAPFLSRAKLQEPSLPRITVAGPLDRPHALIVWLSAPVLPRGVIAGLLRDPLTDREQITFACGPDWSETQIDTLSELLRFYDLPATVMTLGDSAGCIDAVLAAASHCSAETFLLLSPAASFSDPGSRDALRAATEGVEAACPTVLYEDKSIKFAGSSELTFIGRAPFTRSQSRWSGLSADYVTAQEPTPATGGTLECCLLTRSALASVHRARRFSTKFGQEAALFSALRDDGRRVAWLPSVTVTTAEENSADPMRSATALVDNWNLRTQWGEPNCAS